MPKLINKRTGRPQVDIDLKKVELLASLNCTDEEIATLLDISRSSIKRVKKLKEYREAIERGKATTRMQLRALQLKSAKKGNVTMQIYLGKVLLKQSEDGLNDDPVTEITVNVRRAQPRP